MIVQEQGSEQNRSQENQFFDAVIEGHIEKVRSFLSDGMNPNIFYKSYKRGKVTPLHLAVSGDHIEITNLLLQYGADIEHKDGYGNSPLAVGILQNPATVDGQVIRSLLAQGADPHSVNKHNQTPLMMANYTKESAFIEYFQDFVPKREIEEAREEWVRRYGDDY